jgi:hypothetical protein
MLLETYTGKYIEVDRNDFESMDRSALQGYLELRGYAVYDDESTSSLRETAMEDYENEE